MDGLYKISEVVDVPHQVEAALENKVPDLMVYRPDAAKQDLIYCSTSVNHYVDQYDCTELKDSQGRSEYVLAWPYTIINTVKVYSNPPFHVVGAPNEQGFGITPRDQWEDLLSGHNISNTVIRKIRSYLKSKPPINYT